MARDKNPLVRAIRSDANEPTAAVLSDSSSKLSKRASPRLSILGDMTDGIARDFRNILLVIDSGLRLAESDFDDPAKIRAFLAGAREGIQRGLQLTSQLLTFAKQGAVQKYATDANSLLTTLELLLNYAAGPSVRLELDCSTTIPKCSLDPAQFATAILNLVVNARDAMHSGGKVRINTARVESSFVARGTSLPGVFVRVRVEDDGPGMPDHVVKRIFEPFFTTKGENGTGLGIPQVGAFMRQSGGYIKVVSEQGRGTTFDLFFPVVERTASQGSTNSRGSAVSSPRELARRAGTLTQIS